MAIALHHSRAKGSAKLVLIGIANHDGDGGAWPSVRTLAKYAACSVSQVQRSLTDLERLGEVRRMIQAGGDHTTPPAERPNRYYFMLQCPPDCDRSKHHRTRAAAQRILDLDAPMRPGDGSHPRDPVAPTRPDPVAPTRPKPSSELPAHLPATKPSVRARATWSDTTCPGNWREQRHELGVNGKCRHCHEAPMMVDPATGELAS